VRIEIVASVCVSPSARVEVGRTNRGLTYTKTGCQNQTSDVNTSDALISTIHPMTTDLQSASYFSPHQDPLQATAICFAIRKLAAGIPCSNQRTADPDKSD
jgi:hypothetical protein